MKVIKKSKKTVLLEDDNGYRFYVPSEVYGKEDVEDSEMLDSAIPYSLSFDLILDELLDFTAIQEDLYKVGVHTQDDILSNRKKVNDVFRRYLSADRVISVVKR